MGGARRPGYDEGGFGSWWSGTGSENGLEKSSGTRELRNRRLGSSVIGVGQWCETAMVNEWWRDRAEAALASRKKKVCFASSLGRDKDKDGRRNGDRQCRARSCVW
jgi:hypothetical protein